MLKLLQLYNTEWLFLSQIHIPMLLSLFFDNIEF